MKYTEISHFSHAHHTLKLDPHSKTPFKCDGCKEAGIGSHYKCTNIDDNHNNNNYYYSSYHHSFSTCNFDLHTHCALPSSTITHPFYTKCSFQFLSSPPGNVERYCNACEKDVTGFVYHCKACGFDLHPCCAKLPMVLDDGELKLYLYKEVSSPCHRCARKGRSWSYRSSCKKYNFHVACVKEMLADSWHEIYYGGALRDPSKVPSLSSTLLAHNHKARYNSKSKGSTKAQRCCEVAGLALQVIVSAVLGDPTSLIVGLIGNLMSSK